MWVLVGFALKFLCIVSCNVWPVSAASEPGHCKAVKKSDGTFLLCVDGRVAARRGSVVKLPCTVTLLARPAHFASCRWNTVTAKWTVGGEDGDVIYDGRRVGDDDRWRNGSHLKVVAGGDGGPAEVSLVIVGVTEGDVATSYYCHPIVHCGEFSASLGTSHAIQLVWQDPEPPASDPGEALVPSMKQEGSLLLIVILITLIVTLAVVAVVAAVVTRRRQRRRMMGMGSPGCAEPAHEDCQQCAVYTTLRRPLPPPTYDVIAGSSSSVTELRGRAPLMPPNGGVASAKALEVARPRDPGLQYVEVVMDGNEGGAIRSSGEKVHYSHIRV